MEYGLVQMQRGAFRAALCLMRGGVCLKMFELSVSQVSVLTVVVIVLVEEYLAIASTDIVEAH